MSTAFTRQRHCCRSNWGCLFNISSRHVPLAHGDEVLAGVILFEAVGHAGVRMIVEMVGPWDSNRARDLYTGSETSPKTHDLAIKRSALQRKIRLTSRLRLVSHCIAPDLLRIFTSLACCSAA